jgi:hypothetical protein
MYKSPAARISTTTVRTTTQVAHPNVRISAGIDRSGLRGLNFDLGRRMRQRRKDTQQAVSVLSRNP